MTPCRWYSLNDQLKPVEHEAIGLTQALELARHYHDNAGKKYAEGEAALIACTFGLIKNADCFLEITMAAPKHIDVRLELNNPHPSWLARLLQRKLACERTFTSLAALEPWINEFYTLEPYAFYRRLRGQKLTP